VSKILLSKLRYIDLFAGIGGFSLALNRLGHECVYANEWDKYATQTYEKNFGHKPDTRDIRTVDASEIPDHDLLCGGFPCQSFSIAGKRKGFDDTRGTLFFDIARIVKEKKPRYILLENVKGLLSHDKGRTFKIILSTFTELGYDLQTMVLNSKNFGVPQNRERVFIVGHIRGTSRPKVFPIIPSSQGYLKYSGAVISARQKWLEDGKNNSRNFSQGQRIYAVSGISQTLAGNAGGQGGKTGLYEIKQPFVAMQWRRTEKGKAFRREAQKKGRDLTPFNDGHRELVPNPTKPVIGTITSQAIAKDSLLGDGFRIRRLTPIECERLQGFPDNFTQGVSDTQRYRQLGNAVTVSVVYEIAKRLK